MAEEKNLKAIGADPDDMQTKQQTIKTLLETAKKNGRITKV